MNTTEQAEYPSAPESSSAYGELIRQVDRAGALIEEAESRLSAVLGPPAVADTVPKRDRYPSPLGEQVSKLSDRIDQLGAILRRVDL